MREKACRLAGQVVWGGISLAVLTVAVGVLLIGPNWWPDEDEDGSSGHGSYLTGEREWNARYRSR